MPPRERPESAARVFERQCWEMWVKGATLQQVAEATGKSRGSVEMALERARRYRAAINPAETERIREMRMAGLQAQRLDLERRLQQPHPLLDRKGEVVYVTIEDEETGRERRVPAEDHQVAAALHRELRQLDDRIAKLTGSDAATRWEIVPGESGGIEVREQKVVELKERARSIRLLPRPGAIDATSHERREA